jgi:hypothetical protein
MSGNAWRPRVSAAVRRYQAEGHQVWVAGALGAWPHRRGRGGALLRAAVMQASLLPPDVVVVGYARTKKLAQWYTKHGLQPDPVDPQLLRIAAPNRQRPLTPIPSDRPTE